MSRHKPHERAAIAAVLGLHPDMQVRLEQRRHNRLTATLGDTEVAITVASTPRSDAAAVANWARQNARRAFKQKGIVL